MNYDTCDHFNTERTLKIKAEDSNELHLPSHGSDVFTLLLLCRGSIKFGANHRWYTAEAPAVVCLDERQNIAVEYSGSLEYKALYFNPSFLNVNLSIEIVRSGSYKELCDEHSYFQLKPFIEDNFEKRIFVLDDEPFRRLEKAYHNCKLQLELQPDWYWSCRARSYFMDMIQCIELLYYDYKIQADPSDSLNLMDSQKDLEELKKILSYINGNLDTEISLGAVCAQFRTYRKRMEALFKTYLDVTFYEYIQNQRYERICYYLRFTDLKLKEIALHTGISTSQNLCKFFKSVNGKSPNQFRNEVVLARKKRYAERLNRLDA